MMKTSVLLVMALLTGLVGCTMPIEPQVQAEAMSEADDQNKKEPVMDKATFAAGCFWGIEAAFRRVPGVQSTMVGYTGGHVANPTYEQVCTGRTGHAEAVYVEFDPEQVSYEDLLEVFWDIHDPTQLNRQGPDVGTQYRSAIFFHNEEQQKAATDSMERRIRSGRYRRPIVTQIEPAAPFFKAEEYHQQYLKKRGLASCSI